MVFCIIIFFNHYPLVYMTYKVLTNVNLIFVLEYYRHLLTILSFAQCGGMTVSEYK